jgi:hypothetical protein
MRKLQGMNRFMAFIPFYSKISIEYSDLSIL